MLEEFAAKLTKDLELKEPLTMVDGSCALLLDETTVTISEAQAGFQLTASLGEPPSEQIELFMGKMLRGNLFAQATSGSILGLDETGAKIILRYYQPTKSTYRDFKDKLEDFLNMIDFWKQEIASHQANPIAP
jgi:hypothetical protein